jgi:hypothetical protein
MKQLLFLFAVVLALTSCGPERDAKEVCKCYTEVFQIADPDESTSRMNECLEMFSKYSKKHTENGTYENFIEEYDKCR